MEFLETVSSPEVASSEAKVFPAVSESAFPFFPSILPVVDGLSEPQPASMSKPIDPIIHPDRKILLWRELNVGKKHFD